MTTYPAQPIFLSTPSARRATVWDDIVRMRTLFLSTPSARRATFAGLFTVPYEAVFLSTPSARRATHCAGQPRRGGRDFYPRPPRGGRLIDFCAKQLYNLNFYPRPPRGGRLHWHIGHKRTRQFLSTPSARRATCRCRLARHQTRHFYPRPPRGGRPEAVHQPCAAHLISIHALREEGDRWRVQGRYTFPIFLSTPSARRATADHQFISTDVDEISIHALREEGDADDEGALLRVALFLSTPSARRATALQFFVDGRVVISIHALREEGDERKRKP